jgi:hypothetical protein
MQAAGLAAGRRLSAQWADGSADLQVLAVQGQPGDGSPPADLFGDPAAVPPARPRAPRRRKPPAEPGTEPGA